MKPTLPVFLLWIFLLPTQPTFAEANPILMNLLDKELSQMEAAFAAPSSLESSSFAGPINDVESPEIGACTLDSTQPLSSLHALELKNFWFRFRLQVGFSIPPLVNILVVPEIEVLWQRTSP